MRDWTPAPVLIDEHERLLRLARLGVGEGQQHPILDSITSLASALLRTPTALVTLVEPERQFFLSRFGLEAPSTGRRESFCGHCIARAVPLVVRDATLDPRFAGGPLVSGPPHVRAYLGIPLHAAPAQSAVGTLCVIDHAVRDWSVAEIEQMTRLGALVENYLDQLVTRRVWDSSPLATVVLDAQGRCLRANAAFARMLGLPFQERLGRTLASFLLPADRSVLSAMVRHALTERTSPTRRELGFIRLDGSVVRGGTNVSPLVEPSDQVVCMIRDISLERQRSARTGVVADVRAELEEPLERARHLLQTAPIQDAGATTERGGQVSSEALDALQELNTILDARIGDIAGHMKVESALYESEQRLRTVVEQMLGPLLVIDDRGRIVDTNVALMRELGWEYDDVVGASLRKVYPRFSDSMCDDWFTRLHDGGAGAQFVAEDEGAFLRRDGSEFFAALRMMAMDWNGPGRMVVLLQDVTTAHRRETVLRQERDHLEHRLRTEQAELSALQKMEAALKHSLEEKETLLKEVHHRVKNNLQMVSSLLTLQVDKIDDPGVHSILEESVRRVRSMALIHQHLYGSLTLERFDLVEYARTLTETLRHTLAPHAAVSVEGDMVEVSVEQASPIGLILNELITNAFKYGAAPDSASVSTHHGPSAPRLQVLVERSDQRARIRVRDFGPGLPAGFDMRSGQTLGLQLVRTLTRQLRGTVKASSDGGAIFDVEFPL